VTDQPNSNYLVNPFLFMTAVLVDPNAQTPVCPNQLIGSFVSSLHRLKDIDNKGEILVPPFYYYE
jgi:hypothetical protein